ncbi:hypothetical protein [Hymenobacter koreensis]|uniref:Rieske domain-containing protein n=1 Tax=Hymenobacter koreensis TaxID=1084523 RepID=A0ABP8JKN1_9BACT
MKSFALSLNSVRRCVLLSLTALLTLAGCGSSDTPPEPLIPSAIVNENLNLTNQQYAALRLDGGYVYLNAGVRGIIVVRQSPQQYFAFERNCPYQPYDDCAKVSVDASGLFITDACCGSQFDMRGQVTAGPARRPLRQYITGLSGNFLSISN